MGESSGAAIRVDENHEAGSRKCTFRVQANKSCRNLARNPGTTSTLKARVHWDVAVDQHTQESQSSNASLIFAFLPPWLFTASIPCYEIRTAFAATLAVNQSRSFWRRRTHASCLQRRSCRRDAQLLRSPGSAEPSELPYAHRPYERFFSPT